MWEPRRLTTLWVSTACYRDIFTSSFLPFWRTIYYIIKIYIKVKQFIFKSVLHTTVNIQRSMSVQLEPRVVACTQKRQSIFCAQSQAWSSSVGRSIGREVLQVSLLPGFVQSKSSRNCENLPHRSTALPYAIASGARCKRETVLPAFIFSYTRTGHLLQHYLKKTACNTTVPIVSEKCKSDVNHSVPLHFAASDIFVYNHGCNAW
jgi:hypothetical protein